MARRHGKSKNEQVLAVIESMNDARFVRDTLEDFGWSVQIADAKKVKGLAPLARKTRDDRRPGARRAL